MWRFSDVNPVEGSEDFKIAHTNTFGKPPWFDSVASEYAACRETIGLSDYSSFTKIDLWVSISSFSINILIIVLSIVDVSEENEDEISRKIVLTVKGHGSG